MTEGYSAADLTNLAKEAAMGPVRELPPETLRKIEPSQVSLSLQQFFPQLRARIKRFFSSASRKNVILFKRFGQEFCRSARACLENRFSTLPAVT